MILLKTPIQTILCRKKLASCVPVATNCIVLRKISWSNISYAKSALPERFINGPGLSDFIDKSNKYEPNNNICFQNTPYLNPSSWQGYNRKVFFDVYGCQMNVNDTEIVWSILQEAGFLKTNSLEDADVVLVMTCAIREGAENKVWNNLRSLRSVKYKRKGKLKIGVLGCMAERLKHQLLEKEKSVDIVAGPDSYKDLPRLLAVTENNQTAVNVLLSLDETYADVMPIRLNDNCKTAYVSIMRGCDNMCTYCIVPFTRGRERSRPISSILNEVKHLSEEGVKEITLLGQNVNSYRDISETSYAMEETKLAKGFKTVYKDKKGGLRFAELLDKVANVDPEMRIRFTSPHPKDFPDQVLELIRDRKNVCCSLHLPAQSGSSSVLERMRRGYTRDAYLDLVSHVRSILPSVSISSDFICGFCGETEVEFNETLTLLETVKFNVTYLYAYSMREKTTAHRRFQDDVPLDVKKRRLINMHSVFRKEAEIVNRGFIKDIQLVLVEGTSKRSNVEWAGRNDGNIKVIVPSVPVPIFKHSDSLSPIKPGDYVAVQIDSSNSQVLKGTPLYHATIPTF